MRPVSHVNPSRPGNLPRQAQGCPPAHKHLSLQQVHRHRQPPPPHCHNVWKSQSAQYAANKDLATRRWWTSGARGRRARRDWTGTPVWVLGGLTTPQAGLPARRPCVHTSLLGSDRYLAGTLSRPTAIASHLPPCFLHWTGHWGRLPVFVSSPAPSCVIFGEEKTFWAGHQLCTCSCPCVPPHTLPITLTQWHIRPHIFHQKFHSGATWGKFYHFICLSKVLYVCWSHAVASATICNNQRLPLALQSNCLESQNEYCAHVPPTQRWLHFWSKSGAGIGKIHGNNVATILQLKT